MAPTIHPIASRYPSLQASQESAHTPLSAARVARDTNTNTINETDGCAPFDLLSVFRRRATTISNPATVAEELAIPNRLIRRSYTPRYASRDAALSLTSRAREEEFQAARGATRNLSSSASMASSARSTYSTRPANLDERSRNTRSRRSQASLALLGEPSPLDRIDERPFGSCSHPFPDISTRDSEVSLLEMAHRSTPAGRPRGATTSDWTRRNADGSEPGQSPRSSLVEGASRLSNAARARLSAYFMPRASTSAGRRRAVSEAAIPTHSPMLHGTVPILRDESGVPTHARLHASVSFERTFRGAESPRVGQSPMSLGTRTMTARAPLTLGDYCTPAATQQPPRAVLGNGNLSLDDFIEPTACNKGKGRASALSANPFPEPLRLPSRCGAPAPSQGPHEAARRAAWEQPARDRLADMASMKAAAAASRARREAARATRQQIAVQRSLGRAPPVPAPATHEASQGRDEAARRTAWELSAQNRTREANASGSPSRVAIQTSLAVPTLVQIPPRKRLTPKSRRPSTAAAGPSQVTGPLAPPPTRVSGEESSLSPVSKHSSTPTTATGGEDSRSRNTSHTSFPYATPPTPVEDMLQTSGGFSAEQLEQRIRAVRSIDSIDGMEVFYYEAIERFMDEGEGGE